MAKQTINIGAAPNDGTGDPIRTAFDKSNDNFTELYDDMANVQADLQNIDASAVVSGTFADARISQSSVTQHEGALSITESQISDLSHDADLIKGVSIDASAATPSDGDILVYRSAGSDWVLETKPAGGSNPALNDVTDVTITSPADNEVLAYDTASGDWINQTAAEAALATSAQGALADSALQPSSIGVSVQAYSAVLDATTASFTTADETKLDGIEANADVTDTDNVRSAGALMDDEVTNLADVKAFDPANYATAAQGTKADSALQDLVDDTTPQLGGDLDLNGNKILALPCEIGIACSDETTALTTGTAKATFRMPYAMTLTAVRASLTGAGSTSGTTTIDINEAGTTVLSTKLTIDAGEKTSTTAATAAVISDSALADDAEITIDIDAVSGGADETGLKVWLIGTRA